jgi:6-phosphogluconolactonase
LKITRFYDLENWIAEVILFISDCAKESISRYNSFHIVLSGGNTPRLIYPELAKIETNWGKWHFWIGDERFTSESITQLNKTMIQDIFLNKIPYNYNHVHFIKVELGLDIALRDYEEALKSVNMFDLAILGIGEDGHTASLFPDNFIGSEDENVGIISVSNAPKPPSQRLSLSSKRLSSSRNVLFIANGLEKNSIINMVQHDETLPCNKIKGLNESILFYCSM